MWEQLRQNSFLSGGASLMVLGGIMAFLRHLPGRLTAYVRRRFVITVEADGSDPAFQWLQDWLARQDYAQRARNLSMSTVWKKTPLGADSQLNFNDRVATARFRFTPAPGTHAFWFRNRLLILRRTRRDLENSAGNTPYSETASIELIGGNRGMVEDLLHEARQLAVPQNSGVTILTARYDSWHVTSWRPRRPLASVVLADRLLEDLVADVREFASAGDWYTLRGIPYRRGYLLHGPPGNGKTSLVTTLAGELGMAVSAMTLNGKSSNDAALRAMIDATPLGSILLIEDVDCAFTTQRDGEDKIPSGGGVTLSGLLNTLDGVSSREGRILFMTTNHLERLDPALIRPGRVDRILYLAHATTDQARRLFLWFYAGQEVEVPFEILQLSQQFAARIPHERICVAAIQEHLLRYRHNPTAAVHEADFDHLIGATRRLITRRDVTTAANGHEFSAAVPR